MIARIAAQTVTESMEFRAEHEPRRGFICLFRSRRRAGILMEISTLLAQKENEIN